MSEQSICKTQDLVENSGVCARVDLNGQSKQIALFYLPHTEQKVFALDNWDPLGEANVMSRGIVGDLGNELVVASPLYKQHFKLANGKCLEDDVAIDCYKVSISGDDVVLHT